MPIACGRLIKVASTVDDNDYSGSKD
jgi:hypothetical protein